MGKKTSSASSESVTMSSDPVNSPSTESLDQSEVDISIDGQNGEKVKKKEKMGLIKRMSMRREKKKDKEKEKQAEKERAKEQKEKAKEEKEKAKEEKAKVKSKSKGKEKDDAKNKDKQKDEPTDKQEKDKTKDKDRHKEEGQKNTTDKIYRKISMDDFGEKQTEFKLWMLEQQNGSVDNMKASKVKSFFKKFVKEWNKKNLPHRYYWSSEETPPPSRAGSRFSFAEEVQTPDYLNFPAAPVDLSNDDLDSEDGISRSESFSTFGKTQKPEGLNDDLTPTMPKRPLLSAVFPVADNSVNSAKISPTVTKMMIKPVVICEDVNDPPTPTPETSALGPFEATPTLLTYENSPGLLNDALKEHYAITPDNNNVRKPLGTYEVSTSNYTCMEDNILPGEELQVTQLLEQALMDETLQPSGELTPIAEEEVHNAGAKHSIASSSVLEALQPVAEKQIMEMNNDTSESSWEVVNSEAQNGHSVTFTGLPPPPKQWKMNETGLTNTILPPVRQNSKEKTITSTEVTSVPVEVYQQNENDVQNIAIQKTTITTVTQPNQASVTEEITSPSIFNTSTVLILNSQLSPSMTPAQERHEYVGDTTTSPQSVVYAIEEVHSPTIKSPTVTLHMEQPINQQHLSTASMVSPESKLDVHYDKNPVHQKQSINLDRQEATTSVSILSEEMQSPVFKKEIVNERSPERSTVLAPSTVTIHQQSVSIPATSHITLTNQQMPPPVLKQQASPTVNQQREHTVFAYEPKSTATAPVNKEESWEVSPKSDIVVTQRVSHSISTSPPPPVAVQHTVVTRSTPVLHQSNENKNAFVYQQQPQMNKSSNGESVEDVVYRKHNVRLNLGPVSPTANKNEESTSRHSSELKHVKRPASQERKGPHLSPLIVSASTVPMLFQEAMRPKEISIQPDTPTAAHLRSPEKPKPAPRPKSLKSPISPTSKIPVSVTEKPAPNVKPAAVRNLALTPEQDNFKSSHTFVMTKSPTSPIKQPVTFAMPQTEKVSKIPPAKAPRPVSSPISSPLYPAPKTVSADHQAHVVQIDSRTRSLKPNSAVFANESRSVSVQGNQPSYTKFMYEQPSFLAARTAGSRRSTSRISFSPPKHTPNTRMATSYIEPSQSKSTESFDAYNESRVPRSLSDYSVGDRMTVSYTEPSRREDRVITANVNRTVKTEDNADNSLVRPEQTRTTFGPTFMRLSGDRRSLSSIERKQYSPAQKSQTPKPEPTPFKRDAVFSEDEQVYHLRGQTKIRASSGSESSYDSPASNIVNRYLMEIKESTELISVPGTDISKSAENISSPSPREEEIQMRRPTVTNMPVAQPSRIPIHGTSAFTENEYRPIIQVGTGGRQAATLPRNFQRASMGAVVVEMGTSHPSQVKQNSSLERMDYSSTGDRRISYNEQTGGSDLHTPGSRSSYAGFSSGRQYTSPQYGYSEYHMQKPLITPRDRSSFAGTSTQTTLSPEEMARLKEVLRR